MMVAVSPRVFPGMSDLMVCPEGNKPCIHSKIQDDGKQYVNMISWAENNLNIALWEWSLFVYSQDIH